MFLKNSHNRQSGTPSTKQFEAFGVCARISHASQSVKPSAAVTAIAPQFHYVLGPSNFAYFSNLSGGDVVICHDGRPAHLAFSFTMVGFFSLLVGFGL